MRIEAFVPDWPGTKQRASEIANVLARRYPTRILDDPNDYFNAQWEHARSLFTGDVLLWVMADVTLPDNHKEMFSEMERLIFCSDVGWVAPNVDWTGFIFNKKTLTEFESGVYEVPNTDSLCFAIRGDVVRAMPHLGDVTGPAGMWGMDFTAILTAHRLGLKILRDYRFKVGHPNNTGYSIEEASLGMKNLFESFDPDFREEMRKWINRTNNLKVRP